MNIGPKKIALLSCGHGFMKSCFFTIMTLKSGKPTTPSHFAIERGNKQLLEIILEQFADNRLSVINDGWTLIHTAARFGR